MRWILGQFSLQVPRLFLWAPVLFGCGIALFFGLNGPPGPVALAIWISALILALPIAYRGRSQLLRWHSFALIWFILGYLNAGLRAALVAAPVLGWNYYGPIEGRIIGLDRSASNAPRVVLDQVALPGARDVAIPAQIRLSAVGEIAPDALAAGNRVTTTGFLSPPEAGVEPGGFDFRRFAWFNRFGAIGYSRNPVLSTWPGPGGGGLSIDILRLRMAIADWARDGIDGMRGAFAAAIISGDRSEIDPAVLDNLRASNLAHLLAISGLHMGLLSGFVFLLFRLGLVAIPGLALRVPVKKYAAMAALVAAAVYLLVSGANVATQRAFIMAAIVLVAVIVDRPALTLRAVALAALIVLLIAPESLMEAGFQMSFAATTALVATYRTLNGRWLFRPGGGRMARLRAWALGVVITSAVGGLSTAPFSAFHFNIMSHYGLVANVLAVPVMGIIVMPAAVLAALLQPFGLDVPALAVMGQGIGWILRVADWVAHLDGATSPIPAAHWTALGAVVLGGLILCLFRGPLRLLGLPFFALMFAIWLSGTRPDVLIDPDGRLIGVLGAEGRALNKASAYSYAAESWLENDGDAASQAEAFARPGINAYPGGSYADLANGWRIVLHWGRGAPDLPCTETTLLILSGPADAPTGACHVITDWQRKNAGAMAIFIDGSALRIRQTRRASDRHAWQVQ